MSLGYKNMVNWKETQVNHVFCSNKDIINWKMLPVLYIHIVVNYQSIF